MKLIRTLKFSLLVVVAALTLTGCSGGNSSSGLGLSVGGSWNGRLMISGSEYARFSMSIQQSSTDPEDPFSSKELSGVLSSNNKCIPGGELTGTIIDNQISLTIGELRMGGLAGNTNMEGTWQNAGEECIKGGTWTASR